MHDWLSLPYLTMLLSGLGMTLLLAIAAGLAATTIGVLIGLCHETRLIALQRLARGYTLIFRNSPLLVQLLLWYFGVASVLPDAVVSWLNTAHRVALAGLTLSWPSFEFVAGWWGLSLYSAAFIAEECRAGLSGVPAAQRQAGAALGLTALQNFRYVALPQALRIVTPALFGQYMNLVKNSSLTMAIGFAELSYQTRAVESATFKTFQTYGVSTILYIGIIALLEVALQYLRGYQRLPRLQKSARTRQASHVEAIDTTP